METELEQPNGEENLSPYEKTLALVERREEASKVALEILDKEEKLRAEGLMSGQSGGHVETKLISPEEAKTEASAQYFKGTQLEIDIRKANLK